MYVHLAITNQNNEEGRKYDYLMLGLMLNFQAQQFPLVAAPVTSFPVRPVWPTKYNVEMEHLLQTLKNKRMIQSMHLQSLQGSQGVCAKVVVTSLRLLLIEQKDLGR
jgi:hypothetical protein